MSSALIRSIETRLKYTNMVADIILLSDSPIDSPQAAETDLDDASTVADTFQDTLSEDTPLDENIDESCPVATTTEAEPHDEGNTPSWSYRDLLDIILDYDEIRDSQSGPEKKEEEEKKKDLNEKSFAKLLQSIKEDMRRSRSRSPRDCLPASSSSSAGGDTSAEEEIKEKIRNHLDQMAKSKQVFPDKSAGQFLQACKCNVEEDLFMAIYNRLEDLLIDPAYQDLGYYIGVTENPFNRFHGEDGHFN